MYEEEEIGALLKACDNRERVLYLKLTLPATAAPDERYRNSLEFFLVDRKQ